MILRQEQRKDWLKVESLIQKAFEKEGLSDHREQFLVSKLRNRSEFIPELSLVAEIENQIVGHVLLTKVSIVSKTNNYPTLALAPLAVLPNFQKKGIGSALMVEAHKMAKVMGFHSIIILGNPDYYSRFGYETLSRFGISLPFDVPEKYCLGAELVVDALKDKSGEVVYPIAFSE